MLLHPARSSSASKAPLSLGDEHLCRREQRPDWRGNRASADDRIRPRPAGRPASALATRRSSMRRRRCGRRGGAARILSSAARAAHCNANLRRPGPSSALGSILTSGTDEPLKLSHALGDPVLIGDQQPAG
jgi:hypothetical protein